MGNPADQPEAPGALSSVDYAVVIAAFAGAITITVLGGYAFLVTVMLRALEALVFGGLWLAFNCPILLLPAGLVLLISLGWLAGLAFPQGTAWSDDLYRPNFENGDGRPEAGNSPAGDIHGRANSTARAGGRGDGRGRGGASGDA